MTSKTRSIAAMQGMFCCIFPPVALYAETDEYWPMTEEKTGKGYQYEQAELVNNFIEARYFVKSSWKMQQTISVWSQMYP